MLTFQACVVLGSLLVPHLLYDGSFGAIGPVWAILDDERVYLCGTWSERDKIIVPGGGGQLVVLCSSIGSKRVVGRHQLNLPVEVVGKQSRRPQLRWQIKDGRCYVMVIFSNPQNEPSDGQPSLTLIRPNIVSFSMSSIECWQPPAFPLRGALRQVANTELFWSSFENVSPFPAALSTALHYFPDAQPTAVRSCKNPSTSDPVRADIRMAPVDFLVNCDGSIEQYILCPDGVLMRHHINKIRHNETCTEKGSLWRTHSLAQFRVLSGGDRRYYLCDLGKVYEIPPNPRKEALLPTVWKGSPVKAVIQDERNGRSYAFTKDQFFEITNTIKLQPHAITSFRGRTADEAMETAVECAMLIRGLRVAGATPKSENTATRSRE